MLTRGLLGPAISAAPALSTPPFARGDSGLPLPAEPEEALRRMERGLAGSTAPSVLRARGECCGSSHASSVCMCLCFALRPYSSGSAGSSSTSDKCFLRLLCLPIFLCLNSCKRSLSSTPACKATPPKTAHERHSVCTLRMLRAHRQPRLQKPLASGISPLRSTARSKAAAGSTPPPSAPRQPARAPHHAAARMCPTRVGQQICISHSSSRCKAHTAAATGIKPIAHHCDVAHHRVSFLLTPDCINSGSCMRHAHQL